LLGIVANDSRWLVETPFPQAKISHLRRAHQDERLNVQVLFPAHDDAKLTALLERIGPSLATVSGELPVNAVVVSLVSLPSATAAAQPTGSSSLSPTTLDGPVVGAPAQIQFYCGDQSIAKLLFDDLLRSIRVNYQLYFATSGAENL
jgi:hypothetical protein